MPSVSLASGSEGFIGDEEHIISFTSAAVFELISEWQWKGRSGGTLMVVQKKPDSFFRLSNLLRALMCWWGQWEDSLWLRKSPSHYVPPVLASCNVFARGNWCIHQALCPLVSVGPWSPHEPGWPVDFCHQRPKEGKGQQHSGFPPMCSKNTRGENVTKHLQQGRSYKEAFCKSLLFL